MNPKVGFLFRYSETSETPMEEWQQAPISYFSDLLFLGKKRFLFSVDSEVKKVVLRAAKDRQR